MNAVEVQVMKARGYLMMVLHAHLPFVRHPEHEYFLEENWLFEAITETYIPLLDAYDALVRDGIDFRLTMSVTPPLCEMLADELLQERYLRHIRRSIDLAERECWRLRAQPAMLRVAEMYLARFTRCQRVFEQQYQRNILEGFRRFQDLGVLELITCGATHGFAPLLQQHPQTIRAQIRIAAENHERHFGRLPKGIWNAECGYYPGLEEILAESGIEFFFVDTHGVLHADRRPRYGVFAPMMCNNGVAFFGRDVDSSKSVWSANEGYPGDFNYREFYRDIGFDLEHDYIAPYIHPDGIRIMTGVKYYRITGKTDQKEPYDPVKASEMAATHAGNFMFNREKQVEYLASLMDRQPVVVSPYDAELFGHWWYEGPQFIEQLMRKIATEQDVIRTITPSEYLSQYPRNQVARPSFSSWGYKGYCEVWLDDSNSWIYRHLHKAAERMIELAEAHPEASGLLQRALNQAARELLLAQSSDWAFIMKTNTTVEYATRRTKDHIRRFTRLYEMIQAKVIDEAWLRQIEARDNLFPQIDYRVYADGALPPLVDAEAWQERMKPRFEPPQAMAGEASERGGASEVASEASVALDDVGLNADTDALHVASGAGADAEAPEPNPTRLADPASSSAPVAAHAERPTSPPVAGA